MVHSEQNWSPSRSGALASTFPFGPLRQILADKKYRVDTEKSEVTGAGILRQTQRKGALVHSEQNWSPSRSGALASTFQIGPLRIDTFRLKTSGQVRQTQNWNLRQTLTNKGANLGRHRKE